MSDPGTRQWWARATAALSQGNYLQAIEALRRVLSLEPEDAEAHGLLALCLVDARRLAAAETEAKLALARAPLLPLAHVAMGQVSFARRDFSRAEESFRTALELEPDRAAHHRRLGELFSATARRAEAEAAFARALELEPEDPDNLVAVGRERLHGGAIDEAERLARAALELSPAHQDALVLMGSVLLRRGDVAGAREHALWAVSADPTDRGALGLLTAIKAKTSWLLGLWWRYNTWCGEVGSRSAVLVLLGAFVLYRLLTQLLSDAGKAGGAQIVSFAWLGICLYTWVGPGMFRREVQKELESVQLRKDF